jgi:NAD-dependent dihydropyrimidine dehydrogenase PreA subunit
MGGEVAAFVWGPTIDEVVCTNCKACLDFCQQGVYALIDDRVHVVAKSSCMEGCSHCAGMCEAKALTFPTLEELLAAKREAKTSA